MTSFLSPKRIPFPNGSWPSKMATRSNGSACCAVLYMQPFLVEDGMVTYLKTLVTGEAKSAIAELAYSRRTYKGSLKTIERKFGQPQNVITAQLDHFSSFAQLRLCNSKNIISFLLIVPSLVVVFESLEFEEDLKSISLLNQSKNITNHERVVVVFNR